MKKQTLAAAAVLVMMLAATATAEGGIGGILDSIIAFIQGIIAAITGGEATPTTSTTTTQPMCSPPYIQVARECCLDANGNGICDRDEVTTTTTEPTTTIATSTTARTTTTEPTTTTTTLAIECRSSNDCGTAVRVKVCYTDGDIYWVTDTPLCKNQGTPESYCYIKRSGPAGITGQIISEKAEDCPGSCDPTTATCLT